MGDIQGFLKHGRVTPQRRAVGERLQDWREVYLPIAPGALQQQASRCMDCGIPFCNNGCPLGKPHPGVERPRLPRPLAHGDRTAARDEQLP